MADDNDSPRAPAPGAAPDRGAREASTAANRMWGGRFTRGPAAVMEAINPHAHECTDARGSGARRTSVSTTRKIIDWPTSR